MRGQEELTRELRTRSISDIDDGALVIGSRMMTGPNLGSNECQDMDLNFTVHKVSYPL
jgi:hypothetical protein